MIFMFLSNIYYLLDFKETSQKGLCHGPFETLFKEIDTCKNSGCHGNKAENYWKILKILLPDTIRPSITKLGL